MDCGLFAGVSEQFALYVANIHLLVLGFVESSGLLEFFFWGGGGCLCSFVACKTRVFATSNAFFLVGIPNKRLTTVLLFPFVSILGLGGP